MKKTILVLASILLLTGCSTKLSNGENAVVTFKEGGISSNDLYKVLKDNYGAKYLMDLIDSKLLKDLYKTDNSETNYVNQNIKSAKKQAKELNAEFDTYLSYYYGVKDENAYRDYLSLNYKRSLWAEDYAKESVTEKQIKEYYENEYVGDMEVSHILITIDANNNSSEDEKKEAEEKALNTAKEVIAALDKGEKFEDLAKKYSKDEDTSKKGGSLGKINVGDYTSEVVDAAKELKVGTYTTTPVKSSYGYHIVYLKSQDKKPELNDDVTNKIKTIVGNEIAQEPNFYVKALKALREKNEMKFKDTALEKEFNKLMTQYENQTQSSNE